jgi:2-keto-4-pentenoate hydratase/2-oxohepta-3-ene-1,7-dioic acid hydratase in catechol pathway
MNLRISARVNDKAVRESSTRDMPWSIAQLISHVSKIMKLEPGDMLLVGTPKDRADAAVPLQLGDTLDTEIEGVGKLRNKVGDDPSK